MRWTWEEALAYAAGALDHNGCIYAAKRTRRGSTSYDLSVIVTTGDPNAAYWLLGRFGGTVHRQEKNRIMFHWKLHNGAAGQFLRIVRPYLIVKASQADAALTLRGRIDEWEAPRRLTGEEITERDRLVAFIKGAKVQVTG